MDATLRVVWISQGRGFGSALFFVLLRNLPTRENHIPAISQIDRKVVKSAAFVKLVTLFSQVRKLMILDNVNPQSWEKWW